MNIWPRRLEKSAPTNREWSACAHTFFNWFPKSRFSFPKYSCLKRLIAAEANNSVRRWLAISGCQLRQCKKNPNFSASVWWSGGKKPEETKMAEERFPEFLTLTGKKIPHPAPKFIFQNPACWVEVKSRFPSRYFGFSRIPQRILVKLWPLPGFQMVGRERVKNRVLNAWTGKSNPGSRKYTWLPDTGCLFGTNKLPDFISVFIRLFWQILKTD